MNKTEKRKKRQKKSYANVSLLHRVDNARCGKKGETVISAYVYIKIVT